MDSVFMRPSLAPMKAAYNRPPARRRLDTQQLLYPRTSSVPPAAVGEEHEIVGVRNFGQVDRLHVAFLLTRGSTGWPGRLLDGRRLAGHGRGRRLRASLGIKRLRLAAAGLSIGAPGERPA